MCLFAVTVMLAFCLRTFYQRCFNLKLPLFWQHFYSSFHRIIVLKRRRLRRTLLELLAPCGLCAFLVLMVNLRPLVSLFRPLVIEDGPQLLLVALFNPDLAPCNSLTFELPACVSSTTTRQFYDSSSLLIPPFFLLSFSQIVSDATGLALDAFVSLPIFFADCLWVHLYCSTVSVTLQ